MPLKLSARWSARSWASARRCSKICARAHSAWNPSHSFAERTDGAGSRRRSNAKSALAAMAFSVSKSAASRRAGKTVGQHAVGQPLFGHGQALDVVHHSTDTRPDPKAQVVDEMLLPTTREEAGGRDNATWQLSCFPSCPEYCRVTPTECSASGPSRGPSHRTRPTGPRNATATSVGPRPLREWSPPRRRLRSARAWRGSPSSAGGPSTRGDVRPGARATGLGGAVVVPIFRGEAIVGALGIGTRSERAFTDAEMQDLIAAGRQLP